MTGEMDRPRPATMVTDDNPLVYLESLISPWFEEEQGLKELSAVDGAALYKVGDEHYVVLQCAEHGHHRGAEYLAKIMPEGWVRFAEVRNDEDEYIGHHWGPA